MDASRVLREQPPHKRQKVCDTTTLIVHYYSMLQDRKQKSRDEEQENMLILCPPKLRKKLVEFLIQKNEPEMFRLALLYVVDLLTPPEEIPGGAEGKDSLVGDLFFKHHQTNFLEVLLDVFSDLVLAVDAELSLDLLESPIFEGHQLLVKCLFRSVRVRMERYGQRRARQMQIRVAHYLRKCLSTFREWLYLVHEWPDSLTFKSDIGNTFLHSVVQEGSPKQILNNILQLRHEESRNFQICRATRNHCNLVPYTWFFYGNLHKKSHFFTSTHSYNILHVLNYTTGAWVVSCDQLFDLLQFVIVQTSVGLGPSFQMLKTSLFIRRNSLTDAQWHQLLVTAASQSATCSPAPFSVMMACWPALVEPLLKLWNPLTGQGPLHLLIRKNNLSALRQLVRTSGLQFGLSNLLVNQQGTFFAPADPVVTAVRAANFEILRFLFTEGHADPSGFDLSRIVDVGIHDDTPLTAALMLPEGTKKRMVNFLLECGANPNHNPSTGEPFLHRLIRDLTLSAQDLKNIFLKQRFAFDVETQDPDSKSTYNAFQAVINYRGVDRALFLLETIPGFADFSFTQTHPFIFTLSFLEERMPSFVRYMLLLRRILVKKSLREKDIESSKWEDSDVVCGLQAFMNFSPNLISKFQVEKKMEYLNFHTLFGYTDIVGLVAEYVVPDSDGPFSPLDLYCYCKQRKRMSSISRVWR